MSIVEVADGDMVIHVGAENETKLALEMKISRR